MLYSSFRTIIWKLCVYCVALRSLSTVLQAASQSVANACGESTVDNLISMGYLLVNNNKLTEACELFTTLLQVKRQISHRKDRHIMKSCAAL